MKFDIHIYIYIFLSVHCHVFLQGTVCAVESGGAEGILSGAQQLGFLVVHTAKARAHVSQLRVTQHLLRMGAAFRMDHLATPISFQDGGLLAKAHLSPSVPVRRTGSPGRGAWLLTVDTCSCTWDTRASNKEGLESKGPGQGSDGALVLQTETRR